MKICSSLFVSVLTVMIFSGCGGGDGFNRVPFAGTVSLEGDGQQSGSIVATADTQSTVAKPSEIPTVRAAIVDGTFEFIGDDRPVAGPYLFEIYLVVPDEKTEAVPAEYANETGGNTVTYNKLVEVPEGGTEEFSLELTKADLAGEGNMPASGER